MKKIKILLLGFLAVLMVGIVSIANAPKAYADETESNENYNTLLDLNELETISHPGSYYGSEWKLFPNLENGGFRFEVTYANNSIIYNTSLVFENYEVVHYSGDNIVEIIKIEGTEIYEVNVKIQLTGSPERIVKLFSFTKDDVNFNSMGEQSFVKNEFRITDLYIIAEIFVPEEPGDVITPGGSGTGVPPIVNEKGNITPVYLYSGLTVIALGIGAYVYTLGKNKKGKRK